MNGAHLPLWAIALVAAALAPWCARTLATLFDKRARERTERLLAANANASRER